MTKDYTELAATSKRLITKFGRSVTFVKPSTTLIDPSKPWLGSTGTEITLVTVAVFVPPNQVRQFGLSALGYGTEFTEFTQFSEQIAICYPEDARLKDYPTLRDGGVDWGVVGVQMLEPGDKKLLAYVGVRR